MNMDQGTPSLQYLPENDDERFVEVHGHLPGHVQLDAVHASRGERVHPSVLDTAVAVTIDFNGWNVADCHSWQHMLCHLSVMPRLQSLFITGSSHPHLHILTAVTRQVPWQRIRRLVITGFHQPGDNVEAWLRVLDAWIQLLQSAHAATDVRFDPMPRLYTQNERDRFYPALLRGRTYALRMGFDSASWFHWLVFWLQHSSDAELVSRRLDIRVNAKYQWAQRVACFFDPGDVVQSFWDQLQYNDMVRDVHVQCIIGSMDVVLPRARLRDQRGRSYSLCVSCDFANHTSGQRNEPNLLVGSDSAKLVLCMATPAKLDLVVPRFVDIAKRLLTAENDQIPRHVHLELDLKRCQGPQYQAEYGDDELAKLVTGMHPILQNLREDMHFLVSFVVDNARRQEALQKAFATAGYERMVSVRSVDRGTVFERHFGQTRAILPNTQPCGNGVTEWACAELEWHDAGLNVGAEQQLPGREPWMQGLHRQLVNASHGSNEQAKGWPVPRFPVCLPGNATLLGLFTARQNPCMYIATVSVGAAGVLRFFVCYPLGKRGHATLLASWISPGTSFDLHFPTHALHDLSRPPCGTGNWDSAQLQQVLDNGQTKMTAIQKEAPLEVSNIINNWAAGTVPEFPHRLDDNLTLTSVTVATVAPCTFIATIQTNGGLSLFFAVYPKGDTAALVALVQTLDQGNRKM